MSIAEEMGKKQRAISVSEFFEKNRHLLGYDNKAKAMLIIVKEAVDNGLDACEEAHILPEIYVGIKELSEEKYEIKIRDNGPGIVKEQVPKIFGSLLYGSKFHRLKQSLTHDEPIIVMYDGKVKIVPIGEFVGSFLNDNEEVANVTDSDIFAPSFDWNEYKMKYRKVSHLIRHKRENEIIKITTKTNREIKVTGCHSLFSCGENGKIENVEARNLNVGDRIVVPSSLPSAGDIESISILDYLSGQDVNNNWMYVYGIEEHVKKILEKSKIVHKMSGGKKRKFHRVKCKNGFIDIVDEKVKYYKSSGFLPLSDLLRIDLGRIDGFIQTYHHGNKTRIPTEWNLTESLMRFMGLFVAEGHVDRRQIGFTFGKHEDYLVDEICTTARNLGASVTVEPRERSIRVKVFGGVLPILMEKWCGRGARNKRVPEFVFRTTHTLRQHFLDGLYLGDGHKVKGRNSLMLNTTSKNLANDVTYLWSMQGVLSSVDRKMNKNNIVGKKSISYHVTIYGSDLEKSYVFSPTSEIRTKRNALQCMTRSDLCQLEIKSIERIDEGFENVYDISVPGCENFVGGSGGFCVHNTRGQQGLGISCAVLYSQLTTGSPTMIRTSTGDGKTHIYQLRIDVGKNKPVVMETNVEEGEPWHGTEVTFVAESTYRENKQSVLEYIKQTAISNPYTDIIFDSPNGRMEFKRGVDHLPPEPKEIMPHLEGVELGVLMRMLANTSARTLHSFLTTEFSRLGKQSANEILIKAGITKEVGGQLIPDTKLRPGRVTDEQARKIIDAVKHVRLLRPPTDCLSPLGSSLVDSGLMKELNPEFVASVTRPPEVYRGWPFQIEVGLGFGGSIQSFNLLRFANRVPLLYQGGVCAMTKAVQETDWRRYGMEVNRGNIEEPLVVFVHISSVWVPFTSESKEAIANYDVIIKEIKLALQECSRKLSIWLSGKRKKAMLSKKKSIFERYAAETAHALSIMTDMSKEEIERSIIGMINEKWEELNGGESEQVEEEDPESGKGSGEPASEEGKPEHILTSKESF